MDQLIDQTADDSPAPWLWRMLLRLEERTRPAWGWGVLIAAMLLAMLPAVALRANRLLSLGRFQTTLELVGPLAVVTVWLLWGWRKQQRARFGWGAGVGALSFGILILSQLLIGWIPGPQAIWHSLTNGQLAALPASVVDDWRQAGTRFVLWQQGVAAGGAAQDNLVFATFGGIVLWVVGVMTGWLARGVRQGLAAGVPSLWLLAMILLYSSGGRYLLLAALALTIALHLLLEQVVLAQRWQQMGLDYSPGLMIDRLLTVAGIMALVLTLAAVMPSLYYQPLVTRYYAMLTPAHVALEDWSERLFPELRGTSRWRGGGGSGMPNDFLLQGGPNLGSAVVMRVRTDESASYQFPYDEMAAPPGHYMRGRTLAVYDGRGWSNPLAVQHREVVANQRWEMATTWGRKQVVQSVIFEVTAATLFAAPEPVESSADVRLETRAGDDLVTVQAREQSYTVISMVPAVNEDMLRGLQSWARSDGETTSGATRLPDELLVHLEVPESVTERTRELAERLTEGATTDYDRGLAIEQYLRQYTYDLEVPEPPADIDDVADYFLFDLQRGYCDYYATAFVVLARLSGLPTRFATGFAAGQWNPVDGVFIITEGDAHSWPEVYFPEAGWVPFEPTAGRSQLLRVALPQSNPSAVPPPIVPSESAESSTSAWNWQPLLWLVPVAVVIWIAYGLWQTWRRQREDPWQAVLKWGNRVGRPMSEGETVLEYGQELAGYVLMRQHNAQDVGRVTAREIQAVSEQVNRMRYGRENERPVAQKALDGHWQRLRNYLPLVRIA